MLLNSQVEKNTYFYYLSPGFPLLTVTIICSGKTTKTAVLALKTKPICKKYIILINNVLHV